MSPPPPGRVNPIIEENARPGAPDAEWDVYGTGDPTIQGFATDISVNRGAPISFKVKTDAEAYRIDIYRIGYYGGSGARLVASLLPSGLPHQQPDFLYEASTGLIDCGNWSVSATWPVPRDATSGVYIARLVRTDRDSTPRPAKPAPSRHAYGALGFGKLANRLVEPRASHVFFVVRDDDSRSDIVFQTSDLAWHAFNRYGGVSLDGAFHNGKQLGISHRAHKVSYNRPLANRVGEAANQFFDSEYPMVRWLEASGFDVSYISGVDTTRFGDALLQHKVFMSVGSDTYWTREQRRNVEAARDAGVSLAFFSAGVAFWKARFEPSIDAERVPNRTLVCYKETLSRLDHHGEYRPGMKIDPSREWTGTFRDDAAFNPQGANPENALTGVMAMVRGWRHDVVEVPTDLSKHRFWRNTSVAELKPGETALLEGAALGPQWDEDIDNGSRPDGLEYLSSTTVDNVPRIRDFGAVSDTATATHHLSLYRAKSDALVFAAGSAHWSWGLDPHHTSIEGNPYHDETIRIGLDPRSPDKRVQQATVNLLADMGAVPRSLAADLVHGT